MTCSQATRASAYYDDQLDPAAKAEFESHAAACPHCQRLLADFASVTQALDQAKAPAFTPLLQQRIQMALRVPAWDALLPTARWLVAAAAIILSASMWLRLTESTHASTPAPAAWEIAAVASDPIEARMAEAGSELLLARFIASGLESEP